MSTSDKFGATASLVCAVHCIATPLFLALLPALGLTWLDNVWVDRGFLLAAASFVLLAHPKGYSNHKKCVPAILAILGVVGICLALTLNESDPKHHFIVALGGLLIAGSHLLNRHYLHETATHCCLTHEEAHD